MQDLTVTIWNRLNAVERRLDLIENPKDPTPPPNSEAGLARKAIDDLAQSLYRQEMSRRSVNIPWEAANPGARVSWREQAARELNRVLQSEYYEVLKR